MHASLPEIPDCDVLFIAGDIQGYRDHYEQLKFLGH